MSTLREFRESTQRIADLHLAGKTIGYTAQPNDVLAVFAALDKAQAEAFQLRTLMRRIFAMTEEVAQQFEGKQS